MSEIASRRRTALQVIFEHALSVGAAALGVALLLATAQHLFRPAVSPPPQLVAARFAPVALRPRATVRPSADRRLGRPRDDAARSHPAAPRRLAKSAPLAALGEEVTPVLAAAGRPVVLHPAGGRLAARSAAHSAPASTSKARSRPAGAPAVHGRLAAPPAGHNRLAAGRTAHSRPAAGPAAPSRPAAPVAAHRPHPPVSFQIRHGTVVPPLHGLPANPRLPIGVPRKASVASRSVIAFVRPSGTKRHPMRGRRVRGVLAPPINYHPLPALATVPAQSLTVEIAPDTLPTPFVGRRRQH